MMTSSKLPQFTVIFIFLIYLIFCNFGIALSYQGLESYTHLQIDSKNEVTCMDSVIQFNQIKAISLGMMSDPAILKDELIVKGSSIAAMVGSVQNLAVTIHEMKKFKELYEQEAFNDILQDLVNQGALTPTELVNKKEQLSLIYNKIKTYNVFMETIKVKYDLYEDKNKQLHAKVSSEFRNFTIISHHYFKDNNLEGEIVFKAKNTQIIIKNFSLVEVNNFDIASNYDHVLELLRNSGFEVTSDTSSTGISHAKIEVRNVSEGENITEKRSEVATDEDIDSQKAVVDKSENLKSSQGDKQKQKSIVKKTKTNKNVMKYDKTKEFVLSNLQLLKRIFKDHITPAAISLLKNDTVMSMAIRQSYYFLPPQTQIVLSQETYVACCMASKKVIINYIT